MAKEKVEKKEKVDKKAKVEKTEKNNKKAKIDTKLTVQKKEISIIRGSQIKRYQERYLNWKKSLAMNGDQVSIFI